MVCEVPQGARLVRAFLFLAVTLAGLYATLLFILGVPSQMLVCKKSPVILGTTGLWGCRYLPESGFPLTR